MADLVRNFGFSSSALFTFLDWLLRMNQAKENKDFSLSLCGDLKLIDHHDQLKTEIKVSFGGNWLIRVWNKLLDLL